MDRESILFFRARSCAVLRRLRLLIAYIAWLGCLGLLGYEVVQKSPGSVIGPLPGAVLAARADRVVVYRADTGIGPVDRLLHETQEAWLYYRDLALGPPSTRAGKDAPRP